MGYEATRFIGKIDDEFICPICTMVLKEAVQTHCDHLFCSECINGWLEADKSCPVDRGLLSIDDIKPVARFFRNLLDKFDVKCDFELRGCSSIVKLENLQSHVAICEFSPTAEKICDKGCNIRMFRYEYERNDCLSHFAAQSIRQEEQIKQLNDVVSRQREENAKLTDEVNRKQEEISQLNHQVSCLRERICNEPPKWQQCHNIKISRDQPNIMKVDDKESTGFAQLFHPLQPPNSFQVLISNWGMHNWIVIGLTPKQHSNNDRPGWSEGSIGYSSYGTFDVDKRSEKVGDRWQNGDIIECGMQFPQHFVNCESYNVIVYLRRNGQLVTETLMQMPADGLYPTICMWAPTVSFISYV